VGRVSHGLALLLRLMHLGSTNQRFEMGCAQMSNLRYAGFISYSHADKRWARWLHKKLETYRIPRFLRNGGDRRLGKFFLDEAELGSSSDLSASINSALQSSDCLIVICSPASAASNMVAEEIRVFERLHSRKRVFCLVVDGQPAASARGLDPEQECFSPPLLEGAEPLAADVRGGRRRHQEALERLIAGILDVGFDDIKRRELVRRNQRLVRISAISSVVSVGAVALTAFAFDARNDAREQKVLAETETRKSQRILEFVLESFQSADPYESNGLEISAEEILQRSRLRLESDLDAEPEVRRTMRQSMALVYHRLGDYDTAVALLRENIAELDGVGNTLELARHKGYLASSLIELGDYDVAQALLREELDFYRNFRTEDSLLGGALSDLGRVLKDKGELEPAEDSLREAVDVLERLGTPSFELMVAYNNLGVVLQQRGKLADARKFFEKTVAIREERFGPEHPYTARAENNIGTLLYAQGNVDEAHLYYSRALEKRRAAFGDSHSEVAESLYNVGLTHIDLGHYEMALDLVGQALDIDLSELGDMHPAVGYDYFALARVHAAAGDWAAAGPYLDKVAAIRDARLRDSHQLARGSRLVQAAYELQMGRSEAASQYADDLQLTLSELDMRDGPAWYLAHGIKLVAGGRRDSTEDFYNAQLREILDALASPTGRVEQSILTILQDACRASDC
jgi:tetratricopeptide (TPR) repeat protein